MVVKIVPIGPDERNFGYDRWREAKRLQKILKKIQWRLDTDIVEAPYSECRSKTCKYRLVPKRKLSKNDEYLLWQFCWGYAWGRPKTIKLTITDFFHRLRLKLFPRKTDTN